MKRTTIYLDDGQLAKLRRLGDQRGQPVAAVIREAVDAWLETQMAPISGDEWEHRFGAILKRRRKRAAKRQSPEDQVMRDVTLAVRAVRKARSARRP